MKELFSKITYRLRTSRLYQLLAVLLVVALLLGGYFLIRAATDPYDCRILSGISIDGVSVSGMTKGEARKALKAAAEETILSHPLTVTLPEETITLEPKEIGLKLNVRQAVGAAYAIGRDSEAAAVDLPLASFLTIPSDHILGLLETYAQAHDSVLTQPEYHLEGTAPDLTEDGFDAAAPCQTLVLTLGTPEAYLDTAQALADIQALYDRGISSYRAGTDSVTLAMTPVRLPDSPDLDAIYADCAQEAADAAPDLTTYEILPATYGQVFDLEAARKTVREAAWGETLSIPMEYESPEILTEDAYFRDVLGHCETRHTDDENRNTNLRLVCEILDGYILQPGEEFSYNGVIGERTPERGFKPAGAYSGTRLVKDYGGGVCQGSSTLYNCALLADLEVTERVCHGLLVGYLPIGLDAAVNWATKTDFKFRNNFHFPIQIKAEVSDGYMKMQILGVDEKDYYIEMRSSRGDEEHRIYSNSYKYKYDKETGELISKDLAARSSYFYATE